MTVNKTAIATDEAPAAVGPYSQAIRVGQFVFTAGQAAIDPAVGGLIDGDIAAQTKQVMRNLQAILIAAGSDMEHIIKTTVFLKNMEHFASMNEVYGSYFPQDPPARSTIEAARLPLGALVEIEAIALVVDE
jgi:2-iminobutanoate/2-iminopropanoate deaminase